MPNTQEIAGPYRSGFAQDDVRTSPHPVALFDQPDSATLKVAIAVRRYVSFTSARLPEAIAVLGGTGLAAATP